MAKGEGRAEVWAWHKAGGEPVARLPLPGWVAAPAAVLRGAWGTLHPRAWWWAGLGRLHLFPFSRREQSKAWPQGGPESPKKAMESVSGRAALL